MACGGHTTPSACAHVHVCQLALTAQAEVYSVVWVWVGRLPSLWVAQLPFHLPPGRVSLPTLVAGYACIFMVNYSGAAWVHMGLSHWGTGVHMGLSNAR